MIFTSGTQGRQGRTVNHDPEPWVMNGGNSADRRWPAPTPGPGHWDFRPEYAVLDNPILAGFRNYRGVDRAEDWVWGIDRGFNDLYCTPEQREHARKVLARLARLDAS